MGHLKINENQFLEAIELNKLIDFLSTSGYHKLFKSLANSFGILPNINRTTEIDESFLVELQDVNNVKVLSNSIGYDKNGKIIHLKDEVIQNIPISATNSYYFKVSHQYSDLEEGTITVDGSGNMTGIGTKFTEGLRGQPNFPSKISIYSNSNYSSDFEVLSVVSDTAAVLQGDFSGGGYSAGSQYTIVGTFDHSSTIPEENKRIFQYDSCNLEILTATEFPTLIEGEEFIIATVTNLTGTIAIVDNRDSYRYKLVDIFENVNYALLNRDNHFSNLQSINPSAVTVGSNTGTAKQSLLLGDITNIVNISTTGLVNTTISGFMKDAVTPFENGTILIVKNIGIENIYLQQKSEDGGVNYGFTDYAPWLYTNDIQTKGRFLKVGQTAIFMSLNAENSGSGYMLTEWKVLAHLSDDFISLDNRMDSMETKIEIVGTKVFENMSTGDADIAGAKEGDFLIS